MPLTAVNGLDCLTQFLFVLAEHSWWHLNEQPPITTKKCVCNLQFSPTLDPLDCHVKALRRQSWHIRITPCKCWIKMSSDAPSGFEPLSLCTLASFSLRDNRPRVHEFLRLPCLISYGEPCADFLSFWPRCTMIASSAP